MTNKEKSKLGGSLIDKVAKRVLELGGVICVDPCPFPRSKKEK